MTGSFQSMSHSRWHCKYHVVFIPKRRRKAVLGNIRKHLGAIFHELYAAHTKKWIFTPTTHRADRRSTYTRTAPES
jgi:Transposase IS200 like